MHTALLAVIAVLVAFLRIRLAGRYQGVFAVMAGAVVAQPAVHAGSKVLHLFSSSDGHHHDAVGSDVTTGLVHLLLALALVVVVSTIEQVLQLVARTLHQLVRWLRAPVIVVGGFVAAVASAPIFAPVHRLWARHIGRRGPPAGWFAAA